MSDGEQFEIQKELLYKAIEDNQNTIRFTDTKAGAVLVLAGILITLITSTGKEYLSLIKELHMSDNCINFIAYIGYYTSFIITAFSLLLAILLSFKAISPKSGPIKSIEVDIAFPPNLFYLSKLTKKVGRVNILKDKEGYFKLENPTSEIKKNVIELTEDGLLNILIVELQKLSYIREIKIQRVKHSIQCLIFAGGIYVVFSIIALIHSLYIQ